VVKQPFALLSWVLTRLCKDKVGFLPDFVKTKLGKRAHKQPPVTLFSQKSKGKTIKFRTSI
jgi:hypothetical protein